MKGWAGIVLAGIWDSELLPPRALKSVHRERGRLLTNSTLSAIRNCTNELLGKGQPIVRRLGDFHSVAVLSSTQENRRKKQLERKSRTQLNLSARSRRLCDRSELRCIHKTIRSSQVRVVQSVEELAAELEHRSLGQVEVADQRQVERLQSRTIHRVPSHIAKRVSRRRCKRSPIHPTRSSARSGRKDWFSRQIRADRI